VTEHACALCGRPAESRPPGGTTAEMIRAALKGREPSRGALILYETRDGGSAWCHRVCAAKAAA
jgi:hypothetical protein